MSASSGAPTRHCVACRHEKPITAFPFKRGSHGVDAERIKTCEECKARKTNWRKENEQKKKRQPDLSNSDAEDADEHAALVVITLGDFLTLLGQQSDAVTLDARVDVSSLAAIVDQREKADKITEMVWEMMNYRFIYNNRRPWKADPNAIRFAYYCAQNQDRQRDSVKIADKAKQRDRESMQVYDCKGWLFITLRASSDEAIIKLRHKEAHQPYWPIDIPDDVVKFVKKNTHLTLTQIWSKILTMHPTPSFTRKSIYQMWARLDGQKWKRDPDELKSARIILQEALEDGGHGYAVEEVPLTEEPGLVSISFVLPDLLRKWGGRVREISLDSAWNTNGSRYEVYALLGEAYGSGIPLGYLLVQSSATSQRGAKERLLKQFLVHLRDKWNIRAHFTLSDKDKSEINAFRSKRLAILRRAPGYYNAAIAAAEFPFIDPLFSPIAQGGPVSVRT
ncbi:hypothetical protein FA95DRAFT_1636386 [Auriscalpium vulgare]|uniref:Uncharacterized protein n=1 Tax=Auriscalpium vulgare TaxID=40419 RepID=A0ACB8REE1_9AGAM|nr:hypothetical protein FA95DRAFT_1636386 [Auriscalpium vulgare]